MDFEDHQMLNLYSPHLPPRMLRFYTPPNIIQDSKTFQIALIAPRCFPKRWV